MRKILFIALTFLICSCSDRYWENKDQELVVEGWIDAGGYPVVIVTTTLNPEPQYVTLDDLQDHLVRWAKVSVSDGDETVVLTGKYDSNYFPPYIYTTTRIKGVSGKTYSLKVEYSGITATAVTSVPEPQNLISLQKEALTDSSFALSATLPEPDGNEHYYGLFLKQEKVDSSFAIAFPGVFRSSDLKENARIAITRGHTLTDREFHGQYKKGSVMRIRFCTMDEQSWRFWSALEEVSTIASTPIFPMRYNLPSNIEGGLGYWAGYGVSTSTVSF